MLVVFVVQTMDIGQDALFNLVGGTLTLINPIVSLLLQESDTALELTNLLYERLVLFVMECANVFKLLDTKGAKTVGYLFILWKPQDNITTANLWALPPVSFRLDFAHPSSSNWHLFQSSILENDVIILCSIV